MTTWREYPFQGAVAVLFDFGGVSHDLLTSKNSTVDLKQVEERFGLRVVQCDIEKMMAAHAVEPSEVEAVARRWEEDATDVAASAHEPVRENARLFLALREVLEREGARAAAINCHALPDHGLRLPCTAMVELHRAGVLVACEMDVNGLLSAMLLTHLAGRPAFMGNLLTGPDEGTVDISHCVAPPEMLAGLAGDELMDYHGRPEHATAAIELPRQGEATLARLAPDLERVHCGSGQIVGAHHEGNCRNSVTVSLPDTQAFVAKRLESHYALVCGDVTDRLLRREGLEALR